MANAEANEKEGSVFKDTTSVIHKYPLFLENSAANQGDHSLEQARECIQFTAIRQPGITFNKDVRQDIAQRVQDNERSKQLKLEGDNIGNGSTGSFAFDAPTKKNEAEDKANSAAEQLKQGLRTVTDDTKSFAEKLVAAVPAVLKQGKEFLEAGRQQIRKGETRLEDCFIYMPPSVVYSEGAVWQNEELGAVGNTIQNALRGSKSISELLSEFGAGLATPAARAGAVATGAFVAGKVGGFLTLLGGSGIENSIKSTTRFTQNPYEEQLFSNVPFRTFTFNFDFSAVNAEEWKAVQNIISMFRRHSRPTFTISDGNQALYSYPNEFAIKFLHLDSYSNVGQERTDQTVVRNQFVENKNLPKLHNCVLTNITTNYAPDGWQAHEGGEPNLINMQLSFTETKKNTRVDIEKGY